MSGTKEIVKAIFEELDKRKKIAEEKSINENTKTILIVSFGAAFIFSLATLIECELSGIDFGVAPQFAFGFLLSGIIFSILSKMTLSRQLKLAVSKGKVN